MAQPAPPSDEEREVYYYGLPSRPKLIARSSSHPWVNPQMPGSTTWKGAIANMYPRVLRPAKGDPALHQQWNDAASSLRVQIIQAVSAVDWTAIDILSIGLEKLEEPEEPEESEHLEAGHHNTLLIAVRSNSLSWNRGNTLALQCKAILEEHGIKDMHCEIRESDVVLAMDAPSAQSSPSPASLSDDDHESDTLPSELKLSSGLISSNDNVKYRANLSDCLGTSITTMDRSYLGGTKGCYLSLNRKFDDGGPTIVALSCRHAAMDSSIETDGLKEYRYEPSQHRREAIQMDQVTYKAILEDVDKNVGIFEEEVEQGRRYNDTYKVTTNEVLVKNSRALSQTMKRYAAPSSRRFGHLLYASDFEPCTSPDGAQWLRDWALIELDSSRHQKPLSSFTNTVFVEVPGKRPFEAVMKSYKKGLEGIPVSTPNVENSTFRLKRELVPMSELFKPPLANRKDENAIIVAKYGATTGLTIGLGSTLRSITRRIDVALSANKTGEREREVISEEWCIVSAASAKDRWAAFSEPGDCGSCIWDLDGRVAGLLTAGARSQEASGYDMTYAQPMERLLEDIRSKGFDVALI